MSAPKRIFVVCLALALGFASQIVNERLNYEQVHHSKLNKLHFASWAAEHEMPYAHSQHEEHDVRFHIWKDNAKLFAEHNEKNLSWTLGFGPFSAMTTEEFQKIYSAQGLVEAWNEMNSTSTNEETPSEMKRFGSVDWRGKATVEVKNQKQCGSCWSFSVAGAVEGCRALAGRGLTSLSEQHQIDCNGGGGCGGWDPYASLKWVQSTGGLSAEKDYPYKAVKGQCQSKPKVGKIGGFTTGQNNEQSLMNLLNAGPVSISFQGDLSDFQHYRGGVYNSAQCSDKITHAIVAVGYASNCDGTNMDCFIGKNSWGTGWGRSGYFYIARRGNRCAFTKHTARPTGC